MANKFLLKRGTAAGLVTLAGAGSLNVGELYFITDQGRITVGLTTTTHSPLAKVSELFISPMTTAGDVIVGGAAGAATRLGIGANGTVLTSNGTTASWQTVAAGLTNPMTGVGDLIVGGTSGAPTRLANPGAAGLYLISNAAGVAPSWQAMPTPNFANVAGAIGGGAAGSLPYQTAFSTTAFLAAGTNGYVLTMVSGAPAWAAASGGGGGSGIKFTESETAPVAPTIGDIWLVPSTSTWYQRVTNASAGAVWMEINSGASANVSGSGTATINFGNHPGSNEASVAITGQAGITTGKTPTAVFAYTSLGPKTANDHRYAALLAELICGPVTDGVGFTVYATSLEKLTGSFTIKFTWN